VGSVFSRHNRYLLMIVVLAFLAVVVVGGGYWITESERVTVEHDLDAAVALQGVGDELAAASREQDAALDDYLLSGNDAMIGDFQQAVDDANRLIGNVRAASAEQPGILSDLTALESSLADWQRTFAQPAIAAAQAGGGPALDPYTKNRGADHDAVDNDLAATINALDIAKTAIHQRGEVVAGQRTIFTIGGLGILLMAAGFAFFLIRRYGKALEMDALHAGVLNRFTEVTSFASDDAAVASSNLEALALLVHPDVAVTHVLNRSKDRAIPEAVVGPATAEILAMGALSKCAGLIRGSMYVTDDAAAPLSVHCPVHPVTHGTLACVPLTSGESVGSVHLYWERPNAFPLELRSTVARIAEHAALAIGNRRLLAALHGQANTDARTGLSNSRAFDNALEAELGSMIKSESLAVLMLDLDHFKDFNDRHGHPAGDEALRVFANVLRSCIRDEDLAARYGGEEFAVMLPHIDAPTTRAVAERIRSRTESTIIALAPGITDRITVSVGVAMAPAQGTEGITLLRQADEALYRAKQAGRNRVAFEDGTEAATAPATATAAA
jgi:diguanylate cyclase (GGDEF)-like protein